MQCFERRAMYLKLYADAVSEIPRLEFDPDLLDAALSEFGIEHFNTLIALDDRRRGDLVKRIRSVADFEIGRTGEHTASRGTEQPRAFSEYPLPGELLQSNRNQAQNMPC